MRTKEKKKKHLGLLITTLLFICSPFDFLRSCSPKYYIPPHNYDHPLKEIIGHKNFSHHQYKTQKYSSGFVKDFHGNSSSSNHGSVEAVINGNEQGSGCASRWVFRSWGLRFPFLGKDDVGQ